MEGYNEYQREEICNLITKCPFEKRKDTEFGITVEMCESCCQEFELIMKEAPPFTWQEELKGQIYD